MLNVDVGATFAPVSAVDVVRVKEGVIYSLKQTFYPKRMKVVLYEISVIQVSMLV